MPPADAIYRARICKRLSSPGIDSEDSIPPAYSLADRYDKYSCRTGLLAGNRFLGSLKGL